MDLHIWVLFGLIAVGGICLVICGVLLHQRQLAAKPAMPELSRTDLDDSPFRVEEDAEGNLMMTEVVPKNPAAPVASWAPAMLSQMDDEETPDGEKETDSTG